MPPFRTVFLALAILLFPYGLAAQDVPPQTVPPRNDDVSLVTRSFVGQTGGVQITDVTLTGTARRIAGSDDETGTAVLKALATGETRIDMSFPSGNRSAVRTNSPDGPAATWTGPDGAHHTVAPHNLMVGGAWFSPALMLRGLSSTPNIAVTDVGQETHEGQTVEHLTAISRQASNSHAFTTKLFQHLTQVDVYLDPATLLPASIVFNIHPVNDANRDAPMEIRYSDYRSVGGIQAPSHIQQFLNNSLVLDLQIESTAFNTGVSASSWSSQ